MCSPQIFGAAGSAASIAGAVMGYSAQKKAVAAQNAYQKQIYEQTSELATSNLIQQYGSIQSRKVEEQKKAAQEISEISQQALMAKSRAEAGALASGVSGLSVDALIDDYTRKEMDFATRTLDQKNAIMSQLSYEATGLQSQALGRIIGVTPQYQAGPSPWALAANVASSGFDYFGKKENFNFWFTK
jgi:hypothetical protein